MHFLWDSSSEAMLYIDGQPRQAFNSAEGADRKGEYVLRKKGQVKVMSAEGNFCWYGIAASLKLSFRRKEAKR